MRRLIVRFATIFAVAAVAASAADLTGIWTGQMTGRRGEKEDVAFQFKVSETIVTGKMFGDEFDLALEEGSLSGDQISFIVTTTNYYSRTQQKALYTGTIKGDQIELTRSRAGAPPANENPNPRQNFKQTFTLKRLTRH
jgi:hypothetical protein